MLKQKIISKAHELGFELIGFAKYQILEEEISNLENWLSKNYQAGMNYMERNIEKRKDISQILPDCKSVISLGMNYYVNEKFEKSDDFGKVSRYAWGKDYHLIIWKKLDELIEFIKQIEPDFEAKSYVDTGPVMDKVWAVKTGLGWQGKHSNIINKKIGSWFFISTVITNYNFEEYSKPISDFCGTCTACIDACPTSAIIQDYVVDSHKCISYLTIENKNEIPDEFIGKFDKWIFGCDICQDVCPWNVKFAYQTNIIEFLKVENKELELEEIEKMENSKFKKRFNESPIFRSKLKGLKRNAEFLQKQK
ncbi:MAG: tRNA epoxyqueuosine(34) reductase QueG [Ignavibacteriae bacterium]|nr:tRNA epoxyqueuosine(34) reductase QueG [Ignavibacteriota bacterium]MCB9206771.1 tRNA epoxyqueuosine(34) reductase QueG [Ignavibacteriales bacterium]MCB9210221.1 tRNA epoxyqueuosine(34) reductase QueG [Ignavibacteriales bacterium]MCB9259601.1 tRNA epoxyqueuosine(34) reductase QueG [Ignavibacteriales bacterium]